VHKTELGAVKLGLTHDELTDADLPVRFVLTSEGKLIGFRGLPANLTQPAFPIRAAFYYAWYPEAWTRDAIFPYTHYHPSLDYYSADDASVMRDQIDALLYAHLNAAIYSWFGISGSPDTGDHFWRYLTASRSTPLRWAVYYEREGHGDPSVAEIRSDLAYIRDFYASAPAYLKVGGRFVVFVYGDAQDSCGMAERWHEANAAIGAYLVLKAFAGYSDCAVQPDAWHEYSGTLAEYDLPPSAFMISPGFDETRAPSAALPRSIDQWRRSIGDMVASGVFWQLVISFNEWAEGTSVESAREWASPSGYGAYLDALHDELP